MKKRIIASIIVVVLIISLVFVTFKCTSADSNIEKTYTKEELIQLIEESKAIKQNSHEMAENARALGWKNDDDLIKELQEMWFIADSEQLKYQNCLNVILEKEAEEERLAAETAQKAAEAEARRIEEEKWKQKTAEYPAATQIWKYMKNLGWNDYVCAGIMGNLMAEVGGQTLNLRYTASSSDYYGMCQWNKAYSAVWGADLNGQCDFLRDTIKYEFDTYGFKYQKGFNFNSFLNMTNAQQAALAFAKAYERCGSGSYSIRQQNATKAYNYFVN